MGGTLAEAVAKTDKNIALADINTELRDGLAKKLGCAVGDSINIAENSRFIVLGVKPQVLPKVLEEIRPVLENRKDDYTVISMAAGVKLEKIGSKKTIRIMPNLAAKAGKAVILYSVTDAVTKKDISDFEEGFKAAGYFEPIREQLMDAGSAISGCGPAFVFMFIEALADGGVKAGLPRDVALRLACETAEGSAATVLKTGLHPEVLKDAVCSPAGSTIEGVKALEDGAFRSDIIDAVTASFDRTAELGK